MICVNHLESSDSIGCNENADTTTNTTMARFAVSNSHDQSAALWIMTFLLFSYTTLTILVRGFVKISMLGFDDGVAGLAQLLTYGNVFSIIFALLHGLTRSSLNDGDDGTSDDYAGISIAPRHSNCPHSMLTRPGATSERRILSFDHGCGQSRDGIVSEESLPTIGIHTCNAVVQNCNDDHGCLGSRFGGGTVCQLHHGNTVAVTRP